MNYILKCAVFLFSIYNLSVKAQSFEGWIEYKLEMKNPMPDKMPNEIWNQKLKERFGDADSFSQTYFYKGNQYMSEIHMGSTVNYQLYNPADRLIYSWAKDTDTATTIDSTKSSDTIKDVIESEEIENIMGIPCHKITLKTEMAEISFWYNIDYFKVDPQFYTGHKYGHYETLVNKTGALPLKMEVKQFMLHMVSTATDYKTVEIPLDKFNLPKFKEVMASPIN